VNTSKPQVELCAAGTIAAIATAPINKRALFLGGYSFPGHTEFLARLTATDDYAMGFVAANLRVVLISTHVPLAQAIELVRRERFEKTIRLAHHELVRWGIENPRIAVAALNPHGPKVVCLASKRRLRFSRRSKTVTSKTGST
jgi:4-hydroxythreonine-4-phosphate dehydrogenase